MALLTTHANEVIPHHVIYIRVIHRLLTAVIQFHLVTLDYVLSNLAHPLIFQANLALLVAQVVIQSEELNSLFANILESSLDDLFVVFIKSEEIFTLESGYLISVLSISL